MTNLQSDKPMLTTYKSIRFFTTVLALVATQTGVFAQAAAAATAPAAEPVKQSVYTSPVFYALALVALVLLIFIFQLSKVVSAVAKNYQRGDGSAWDKMKMVVAIITATLFFSQDASAQAADAAAAATAPEQAPVLDFLHQGFGYNAINALVVVILIELFVVVYLVRMIKLFIVKEAELSPLKEHAERTSVFWDKLNASVAIEKEAAVLTDHDYDGIRELDNALPPWWKYGFYFTIVWAMVYLVYFHISNGPSSADEYKAQMDAGAAQVASYQAKAKDLVTEKTVTLMTEASDIDAGKAAFVQYCAVCHGPDGGGIVGPNLTDKFWLHGGDVKDVFTTIKYGVAGKGMKSWQQELSPKMIAQVSSFVLSLQGTTPASPKAPEGTEYIPGGAAADTTQTTATDTLVTDSTEMMK
ncbi:MAG: c-type cytochrome [Flavobacteriales bacterium]|nr:c-type cytochrome [Flavobacteriales bacterium]